MAEEKLEDMALRFAKLNPTFIRLAMEMHYTKGEYEISQGKIIRWKHEAQNKELK